MQGGRPRYLDAALLLGLVVLGRLLALRACHVYDDAFITYRYAANLARGEGLVYHPGAPWEPVLGTTSPGYAVFLAGWGALGLDLVQSSRISNVVFDALSALLLLDALRGRALAGTIALVAFAGMPELARVSAGGMETPALLCVGLAAMRCLDRGRPAWAGALAALACTLRPEALLLVAALAWRARRDGRLARFLVPATALGLLYAAALTYVYGSPIPQSVSAKASRHSGGAWLHTWREIARQAWLPRLQYLPLLPFVLLGWVGALRRREPTVPLIAFGLAIPAAYLAARPHTWGWYFYVPLASWVVGLGLGVDALAGEWLRRRGRLLRSIPALAVGAGALALSIGTRGRVDRVGERVYRPLAEWAQEVDLAGSGARVLASDIGALGYYGRGPVLDSEGLVWPTAVAAAGRQLELIHEHRPEFLLITAVRARLQPLAEDPWIDATYERVRRFSARGETRLDVTPADLPRGWEQDYLVFARRDR